MKTLKLLTVLFCSIVSQAWARDCAKVGGLELHCARTYFAANSSTESRPSLPGVGVFRLDKVGDDSSCKAEVKLDDASYGFLVSAEADKSGLVTLNLKKADSDASSSATSKLVINQPMHLTLSFRSGLDGKGEESGMKIYQVGLSCRLIER